MDERTRARGERWRAEPETQQLRKLQTVMADAEAAMARRMNMGHSDIAAMTHLASVRQPVGPGWLGARLGLTPAAATELVDRLERVGHVARQRDHTDRRRVNLIPTESALDEVHALLRPMMDAVDLAAEEFDHEERVVIRRFLDQVITIYADFASDIDTR